MAIDLVAYTPKAQGNPTATTPDFAPYIQDGDMLWAFGWHDNTTTTTASINGTGWTKRINEGGFTIASNFYWWVGWSKRWTTGDATTVAITSNSVPQNITACAFIFRSNYDADCSHWSFVANTQQVGAATPSTNMNQLTPTDTTKDLRIIWLRGNSDSVLPGYFHTISPVQGVTGAVWGALVASAAGSPGSGSDRAAMILGRGVLPVDSGAAQIDLNASSQAVSIAGFSLYDGDDSGPWQTNPVNVTETVVTDPDEIDSSVPAEGMDTGDPAGLTAAGGRFEGGSHIY